MKQYPRPGGVPTPLDVSGRPEDKSVDVCLGRRESQGELREFISITLKIVEHEEWCVRSDSDPDLCVVLQRLTRRRTQEWSPLPLGTPVKDTRGFPNFVTSSRN